MLKLLITNPNFLILDELTNDFDIDTLNVLEDFLEKFSGCLILVSHDRYFMDHLVNTLFVFEGDGVIREFNGNYSDYRDWVEEREQSGVSPAVSAPKEEKLAAAPSATAAEKRKLSFKEKQEYEKLPSEIETLKKKKGALSEQMNASATTDHVQLQKWLRRSNNSWTLLK